MKKKLWTFLWITIGVLLISVAYYFFLEPSKLVTGGVTGLMIMLEPFLPFPPSILMYILNISLLLIGLFLLGKDFFFKTCYASVLSPTFILILEKTCEPDIILKGVNPNNWYFISTQMYYDGEVINVPYSPTGPRSCPTAFLIK